MRPSPVHQFRAVSGEPTVDRGRRDPQRQPRRLVADVQLTLPSQPRHQIRQRRRQQAPTRRALHRPQEPQRLDHLLAIHRWPRDSWSLTTRKANACRSALRAWSRCQPIVAHNSSRIAFLPARSDRPYRVAIVLVTALRSLIVSSMPHRPEATTATPPDTPLRGHL
ncbi:hypothetical protein [Rhodoglobus vestalii]|uniref:hypothetical protein n=1 Tax=Rhodoglobus vestalii TaxID=193384 RepID=UPI00115304FA|nr:hypothetical protein [Rhodoglobus vestalii]